LVEATMSYSDIPPVSPVVDENAGDRCPERGEIMSSG
jgi:hypothetical protein